MPKLSSPERSTPDQTDTSPANTPRAGTVSTLAIAACLAFGLIFATTGLIVASTPGWMGTARAGEANASRKLRPAIGEGTVRALVIGIDVYARPDLAPTLSGAVADALDLANALKRGGVLDLTVLVDAQATRPNVVAGLEGLVRRSVRGDLVVMTFAGHGSRVTEAVSGSEPDGLDEFFMLHGFDDGAGLAERIVDDEMFHWMRQLTDKGVEIVFLADSCHGGGMTKAADARAGRQTVRSVELPPHLAAVPMPRSADWDNDEGAAQKLPGLTFLGAVDAQTLAPEIDIPGVATRRGAASYVLARAIEGEASDANGATTRHALMGYMNRNVRILSLDRQTPVLEPRRADRAAALVFRHDGAAPQRPAPSMAAGPVGGPVTAPTAGMAQSIPQSSAPKPLPQPTSQAPAAGLSDDAARGLLFDPATGDVLTKSGAVVAFGVGRDGLKAAVERYAAFGRLSRVAARQPFDLQLTPADRVFGPGERFRVRAEGTYGRHVVIANLAGNGELQLLFPKGNAPTQLDIDVLDLELTAAAPFGSDTLLIAVSDRKLRDLELSLTLLSGKRRPLDVAAALEAQLGPDGRLGLVTFETKPR